MNVATFEVEADGAPRSIVVEAEKDRVRLGMGRSWRTYYRDQSRGSVDVDMSVGGLPLHLSVDQDGAIRLLVDGTEVEPTRMRLNRRPTAAWGQWLRHVQVLTGISTFLLGIDVFGLAVAEALGRKVAPMSLPLEPIFLGCVCAALVLSARVAMGGKICTFLLLLVTFTDLTVRSGLYAKLLERLKAVGVPPWLPMPSAANWPALAPPWLDLTLVCLSTLYSVLLLLCLLRPSRG